MKSVVISLCFACIVSLVVSYSAQARVYLDFTSPNLRKVPTAVPYFNNQSQPGKTDTMGKEMATLLTKALEFHGFISVIPSKNYGGRHDIDWKALGANLTVIGRYTLSGADISLELILLDIIEGRRVFGRKYKGPKNKHKKMVLKFCDEVVKHLTGELGISRSKIAFVSDKSGYKEIYVADVFGQNIRQVTRHKKLAVAPRFSPDGSKLAYTSYHKGNPNLYITSLSQNKTTRAVSRRQGLNLAPAWNGKDGTTMAITLSQEGNSDLYLMDTAGKIKKKLTANSGINVSPSWSPDGKRIAFVSDRSGTPQIYIMNVKNGKTNRITFLGSDNSQPTWSPKGDWIAYTGLYEGSYHIFIIRPDGSSPVRITKYAGNHESPGWSPDGHQLIFSRRLNGKQELYVIFKNGSDLRRIFFAGGHQGSPQWSARMIN